MSAAPATTRDAVPGRPRRWRPGRRPLALLAGLLTVAAVIVAVTLARAGGSASSGGVSDNGTATALATVTRRSLSSQMQVDGTLGYADSSTIVAPSGTAPSSLRQARQSVASAQAALRAALAGLSADRQALQQAQARLVADRQKQAIDCRADNAAASSSSNPNDSNANNSNAGSCTAAAEAVASDEQSVTSAQQKVTTDTGSVSSDRVALGAAEQSLDEAESSATLYEAGAAYTMLPQPGAVVRRGELLYAVDGRPVLLLFGGVTAWRAFRPGMSPGRDVAELNANLEALGYGSGLGGDSFTAATAQAIVAMQAAHGLPQTGALPLGSVVFEPGAVRVTSVTPTLGQAVQPGSVLSVTSTSRQVTIELDAAQQAQVKVGDPVTITLPSNQTTPGRVSFVGSVATTPSNSDANGSSSTPTIEVDVTPTEPAATGRLDQAPVQISITTATVESALVVPVNALLALAGGGYGVETVDAAGVHRLVAVTLGLFDDADGLVQVSGSGVRAGQRVVVPAS